MGEQASVASSEVEQGKSESVSIDRKPQRERGQVRYTNAVPTYWIQSQCGGKKIGVVGKDSNAGISTTEKEGREDIKGRGGRGEKAERQSRQAGSYCFWGTALNYRREPLVKKKTSV